MANEDYKEALIATLIEENAKLRNALETSLRHAHEAITQDQELMKKCHSLRREYEELTVKYKEALKAQEAKGETDSSVEQIMRTMQQQIRSLQNSLQSRS